jgi:hypothetical protein
MLVQNLFLKLFCLLNTINCTCSVLIFFLYQHPCNILAIISNFFKFKSNFSNFRATFEQLFSSFGATFVKFTSTICRGLPEYKGLEFEKMAGYRWLIFSCWCSTLHENLYDTPIGYQYLRHSSALQPFWMMDFKAHFSLYLN